MPFAALGRRATVLIICALAAGLGAAGIGLWSRDSAPPVSAAAAEATAASPQAVGALGRIEPQSEIINIGSGITDRLETLSVQRGDTVKKGQILGYLQSHGVEVAQRAQIAAQLSEAKLRLQTEMELDRAKIDDATLKLNMINEVSPLKIAAQEDSVNGLEVTLKNNQTILDADAKLLNEKSISQRAYDDQQALVLQGEANLAAAKAHLAELRQQFKADVADGESRITLAKASMERARADFAIDSLTKELALADERIMRTTLYAPIDGRILNILAHPGEVVGSSPILVMGNTDKMWVVAEVYETDIGLIRIGQTARVTSRVLTTPVTGHVIDIGHMIFKDDVLNVDPAARTDARIVEVRIELDDAERTRDLTNHTVNVLIDVSDTAHERMSSATPKR